MKNAPRTYHSETSFDLSIPEYLPLEETLDHVRDASEAYGAILAESFEQLGLGLEVKAPVRPFLLEIGAITIVISITFPIVPAIGGGVLGIYALKKLIDGVKEVTVSELKARIERETGRQKAEIESQRQSNIEQLKTEYGVKLEDELEAEISKEISEQICKKSLSKFVVNFLKDKHFDVEQKDEDDDPRS